VGPITQDEGGDVANITASGVCTQAHGVLVQHSIHHRSGWNAAGTSNASIEQPVSVSNARQDARVACSQAAYADNRLAVEQGGIDHQVTQLIVLVHDEVAQVSVIFRGQSSWAGDD